MESRSHRFSIQNISDDFALILRRSDDVHFDDEADTVCFIHISSFLPPKAISLDQNDLCMFEIQIIVDQTSLFY